MANEEEKKTSHRQRWDQSSSSPPVHYAAGTPKKIGGKSQGNVNCDTDSMVNNGNTSQGF